MNSRIRNLIGFVIGFAVIMLAFRTAQPIDSAVDTKSLKPSAKLSAEPSVEPITARLEVVSDGVELPVALAADAANHLYISEQSGRIRVIENGKLQADPVLDLSKAIVKKQGYDERGLLGLALHPGFAQNRKFYVYYSAPGGSGGSNHKSVVQEFQMKDATHADPATGRVIMEFDEPESNHNGGCLAFGPDGYLYISAGDGGGAGDRHGDNGNGQNLSTLLGKILRIDVNKTPYGIPADNPFVSRTDAKKEIYAYGLRNPWRFSFDKQTGRLFAGDVGQNLYEEIDIIQKGGNYGWRVREGLHEFDANQKVEKAIDPITEYRHGTEGISIAGGYLYRGKDVPQLAGKYLFGDYIGTVYYLSQSSEGAWTRESLRFANQPNSWMVYAFGEDNRGEVYVLAVLPDNKGVVYRVAK